MADSWWNLELSWATFVIIDRLAVILLKFYAYTDLLIFVCLIQALGIKKCSKGL